MQHSIWMGWGEKKNEKTVEINLMGHRDARANMGRIQDYSVVDDHCVIDARKRERLKITRSSIRWPKCFPLPTMISMKKEMRAK